MTWSAVVGAPGYASSCGEVGALVRVKDLGYDELAGRGASHHAGEVVRRSRHRAGPVPGQVFDRAVVVLEVHS